MPFESRISSATASGLAISIHVVPEFAAVMDILTL